MKKLVAFALSAIMMLSAVSALAYGQVDYSIVSSSKTVFSNGHSSAVTSTGKDWYITMTSHNLSSKKQGAVRIHDGYNARSATWVYKGNSTTTHGYNTGYTGGGYSVQMRGRADSNNTDANVSYSGVFYY